MPKQYYDTTSQELKRIEEDKKRWVKLSHALDILDEIEQEELDAINNYEEDDIFCKPTDDMLNAVELVKSRVNYMCAIHDGVDPNEDMLYEFKRYKD